MLHKLRPFPHKVPVQHIWTSKYSDSISSNKNDVSVLKKSFFLRRIKTTELTVTITILTAIFTIAVNIVNITVNIIVKRWSFS